MGKKMGKKENNKKTNQQAKEQKTTKIPNIWKRLNKIPLLNSGFGGFGFN